MSFYFRDKVTFLKLFFKKNNKLVKMILANKRQGISLFQNEFQRVI